MQKKPSPISWQLLPVLDWLLAPFWSPPTTVRVPPLAF